MPTQPSVCASIAPRLEAWASERLGEAERRDLAAHLEACPACRTAAVAVDPSALFLAARGTTLPEGFWAGFDTALRQRIAADNHRPALQKWADRLVAALAETRAGLADAWRPAVWLAPAAAAVVVLVTFAVLRPMPPAQIAQAPRIEGIPSPYVPQRPRPEPLTGGPTALGTVGAALAPAGDAILDPPALEEVASPSARVYRFDGAGQDAPPIYLVVDESIEF
ncbi:MAG TPA: zf-HC2 domain-containing protein [Candidatus Polarisedimenticolia bacterium]|nr:zf-HC2 domain-containing protein [Candidatus Polarisedimenticolia bacterium]